MVDTVVSVGLADGVLLVNLLEQVKRLLLFAIFGDEAFAVEAVLEFGDVAPGGAKVSEHPRADAAELRDVREHDKLVAEDVSLLLFGPPILDASVIALLGLGAELGHDDGLLREAPLDRVGVLGRADVPAEVFILTDDVESFGEGVILHDVLAIDSRADEGRGDGTGLIEAPSFVGEVGQKRGARWIVGRLVGDGPHDDGGLVAIAADDHVSHDGYSIPSGISSSFVWRYAKASALVLFEWRVEGALAPGVCSAIMATVRQKVDTYATTISTFQQHRHFQKTTNAELFIQTLLQYRAQGRFLLHAYVVMPDQCFGEGFPGFGVYALASWRCAPSHALGAMS